MVLQCRITARVFCTSMTLSTSIVREIRRQGVLWGFAAAFTKGCSSKEREKRRVFAQRMRRGADVTLDHKVPRTFHLIANRATDFKAEVEEGRGFHHTPSDRRVHSAADKALN